MRVVKIKRKREALYREILEVLGQWPDLERRIFYQTHYYGHSPEDISRSFKLDVEEVRMILGRCDRLLHTSLRKFRKSNSEKHPVILPETVGLANCG